MPPMPTFSELIAETKRSAVHLELRDTYFSNPRFEAWRRGNRIDWADRASWWGPFEETVADAGARGVQVRRARVVSEPVTDYIRWEHYVTQANVEAGEQVRWLPRRQATDLLLPSNDFWLFDDCLARVHHFSGDGEVIEDELSEDPELVGSLAAAFERVWDRAIPHDTYEIR
ncbi:DUF6879 family protein [Streptomyces sp. NPDC049936]|uniref:DUF6879 family protein n=1 Tax=Streptomyces sp. NPDC049936 TaxID=3365599 RepID=UPI0037A8CC27